MTIIGWADEVRKQHEEAQKISLELEKAKNLERIKNQKKLESLSLYHFTDKSNLPSIRNHGLLAWKILENELDYVADVDYLPGSDADNISRNLDGRYRQEINDDLNSYIRLSSHKKHWMAANAHKRGLDITFLKISNNIFKDLDCIFSDMNTNKNASSISRNPELFLNSEDPHAEILVHRHIPVRYILGKESL